jgi:hypothetical protein
MLSTIKGIYNNGEITLEEHPEVTQPIEVLVTFVKEVRAGGKKPSDLGFEKILVNYTSSHPEEPLHDVKEYMY